MGTSSWDQVWQSAAASDRSAALVLICGALVVDVLLLAALIVHRRRAVLRWSTAPRALSPALRHQARVPALAPRRLAGRVGVAAVVGAQR